jgi:hypothetical protein
MFATVRTQGGGRGLLWGVAVLLGVYALATLLLLHGL